MVERNDSNEVRALTSLAFRELSAFPGAIRDTHLGIAERAFHLSGASKHPAKLIHDGVSQAAYGAVGTGASLLGKAIDGAMAATGVADDISLSSTPRGSFGIAFLNGIIGDRLQNEGSILHEPASIRVDGHPVEMSPSAVSEAFPDASSHLVIFVHCLTGNEFTWTWGKNHITNPDAEESYGARLARELDCTPVYVRYNTGLHISESSREVAELLEELVAAWPVEVEQISMIGHSMGGLVSRSATHQANENGQQWVKHVQKIVSIGVPHSGAPLERAAHKTAIALSKFPETQMFGSFLKRRSAGIRDLRYGSLVDQDWKDQNPEALQAIACQEVPLLPGATHYFVSACLTRNEKHPIGVFLGDILVLVPSARGEDKSIRLGFQDEHGHHIGGIQHLALLNHPEIHERLHEWLSA